MNINTFHRWFDEQDELRQFILVLCIASLTAFGKPGYILFGLIGLSRIMYVQKMEKLSVVWHRMMDAI